MAGVDWVIAAEGLMKRMIDLVSDTATRPTPEMRRFMADAPVGDEQLREDPTVNRLQDMVADLTGKESALFLPSGTMCNAIGIKIHTQPGDRIILERNAHPYTSEAGGPGLLSGVMTASFAIAWIALLGFAVRASLAAKGASA